MEVPTNQLTVKLSFLETADSYYYHNCEKCQTKVGYSDVIDDIRVMHFNRKCKYDEPFYLYTAVRKCTVCGHQKNVVETCPMESDVRYAKIKAELEKNMARDMYDWAEVVFLYDSAEFRDWRDAWKDDSTCLCDGCNGVDEKGNVLKCNFDPFKKTSDYCRCGPCFCPRNDPNFKSLDFGFKWCNQCFNYKCMNCDECFTAMFPIESCEWESEDPLPLLVERQLESFSLTPAE